MVEGFGDLREGRGKQEILEMVWTVIEEIKKEKKAPS